MGILRKSAASITAEAIIQFSRLVTAVQAVWRGADPGSEARRIYIANHVSHGDFVLLWAVLPSVLREKTRPVAGAEYWLHNKLRRFIANDVFNALLISRQTQEIRGAAVAQMSAALEGGSSLIFFPEGTRNQSSDKLLPFKSGLYWLAKSQPQIEIVPVWIDNLNRVLPKGAILPVPLMCKVVFGEPITLGIDEEKDHFLQRSYRALLSLSERPNDL